MDKTELHVGDVVQIDPMDDCLFGACFMTVTELKPWGAQGYIQVPAGDNPGQAYYRCHFENMVRIGRAEFMLESDTAQQEEPLSADMRGLPDVTDE